MSSGELYFIFFEDLLETEEPLISFRGFPAGENEPTFYAKLPDRHDNGSLIGHVAQCLEITLNLCVGGFSLCLAPVFIRLG